MAPGPGLTRIMRDGQDSPSGPISQHRLAAPVHERLTMTLTITDKRIRSVDTPHQAEVIGQAEGADLWGVSWLPGKALTHRQALAAMEIADAVGRIPADCDPGVYDDDFWTRVDAWGAELGLSGPDAVARVSEAPAE